MNRMDDTAVDRAAALLVEARHSGTPLERLPDDCRPATAADALRIQAATVRQLGDRIAGWKVGTRMDGRIAYGVLLGSRVVQSGARLAVATAPLLGMEAEIAFRFVRAAPARDQPYTYDEVADRVEAFVAIEVVATRYRDYAGTAVIERLADCMSNGAFVVGSGRPDWRAIDFSQVPATLFFDDRVVVEKTGGHAAGDPLLPAVELVNDLRSAGGVTAGQMMTTGTFTGLHYATGASIVRATFANFGSAELALSRA
jgi:2-keto-4-pentenoate hydratase